MGIRDLNSYARGCWPDFNSGVKGLVISTCDAHLAGSCHDVGMENAYNLLLLQERHAILTIRDGSKLDSGPYRLQAENDLGMDSAIIKIQISGTYFIYKGRFYRSCISDNESLFLRIICNGILRNCQNTKGTCSFFFYNV
jgi:hypothetical protein